MSRLFCFGLGYSAQALAATLAARGWRVAGTAREEADCALLAALGYDMHLFRGDQPLDPAALAGSTHVLISVPPGEAGDPVLRWHGAGLAALPELRWAGYLSTTGVYGDRGGALVDEGTPPAPGNERARRRLAAEAGWQELARQCGLPLHIFRLAGIYGPGRSPLDAVRAGRAVRIDLPGHVFSRIHVADLAAVLRASMAKPLPGAIYNVADDEPAAQADVVACACRLLGRAVPRAVPLAEAPLSALARSFYGDNKRVSNRRIKDELGVTLLYPTYREGLAAILTAPPPAPRS